MVELKSNMANKLLATIKRQDPITQEVYYEIDLLTRNDLVKTFIEIETVTTDDFLKINETLTRIGIANRTNKELNRTCHLLHKKGKYYIVHFLEMFGIDSKPVSVNAANLFFFIAKSEIILSFLTPNFKLYMPSRPKSP